MITDILALDVGSGTQDILIYQQGREMENNYKLVMPSQTQVIASKIRKCTENGEDIFIYGHVMGGGASSKAIRDHIQAGYHVYATKRAAYTVRDDLNKVKERGIEIVSDESINSPEEKLQECNWIKMQDVNLPALEVALQQFGVNVPDHIIVAVQDHGFSPTGSNRKFRFSYWENFLREGGKLNQLLYKQKQIPDYFTRMEAAVTCCKTNNCDSELWAMDTGAAAILGAMEDSKVKQAVDRGAVLINIGNQHTIAFMINKERVLGVFEHHTKMLTERKLKQYLQAFVAGRLESEQVLNDNGHGCMMLSESQNYNFDFWSVTGPKREMGKNFAHMAIPHGDMMMSGPFGMVRGLLKYGQER